MTHSAVMQNLVAQPASLFHAVRDIVSQDRRKLFEREREVAPDAADFSHQASRVGRDGDARPFGDGRRGLPYDLRIEAALRSEHQLCEVLVLRLGEKVRALSGAL